MNLVEALEQQIKSHSNVPELRPGDTVRVFVSLGEGRKAQPFQGTVIRLRQGGASANFTVRRIASHGIGVERTFPRHSKLVEKVEVLRRAHIRRAKLYYLRDRRGKAARLREKRRN